MIKLRNGGVYLKDGRLVDSYEGCPNADEAKKGTIAYRIMKEHDRSLKEDRLNIKFDSLISHDITYVGIIQTAKGSGMKEFPVPYVMTNCHNSLCAVGGTINEDDHVFGLSAAKKYGGIYVPANTAVIHQYAREMMSGCGRMILGSDSHTRYGALGTMGVGEGGPEIVKQLLSRTYDLLRPEVILVYLTGKPKQGVGPHDVAVALCGEVYDRGFVKNKILEFVGPGVSDLPMDYRIGIDVMTTETACLSSIWQTDEKVKDYFTAHGRPEAYKKLEPMDGAYYDGLIEIDLSTIEPMAALPFHPSKAFTIKELKANAGDIFRQVEKEAEEKLGKGLNFNLTDKIVDGNIMVDQGVIAGCSGGMYDNIAEAAAILDGASVGDGYFSLSVYPSSMPVNLELIKSGVQQSLMECGAVFKPCFCGPCFGAGDVPSSNGLSIRHTTRNFPNREGSKPGEGQVASVMLMDSRSIAATARNKGILTGADEIDYEMPEVHNYKFDKGVYEKRVYFGFGKPQNDQELRMGPNIAEWPKIPEMPENLILELASVIHDPVTTTDELIPSGETSSYRSNPLRLAEFTLSRRDPEYVGRAKNIANIEKARTAGDKSQELEDLKKNLGLDDETMAKTGIASVIYATKPGDGSAREQAASCQRVLGGGANICKEFATKRYRSNCINWGMVPFTLDEGAKFDYNVGDIVYVPGIKKALEEGATKVKASVFSNGKLNKLDLNLINLSQEERKIILSGCLMNYYAKNN